MKLIILLLHIVVALDKGGTLALDAGESSDQLSSRFHELIGIEYPALKSSSLLTKSKYIYRDGNALLDVDGSNDRRAMIESFVPSNSSIFSSFVQQQRLSDQFQIKSTKKLVTTSGAEVDLCLQAKALSVGSRVITQQCFSSRTSQKWSVDEYGRIHSVGDENLCISKASKNNMNLSSCGTEGLSKNMFVLNAFENTINYRVNGLKAVGVKGDAPLKSKPIILPSRVISKKMQQWTFVPETLFLSTEDIPSEFRIASIGASKCLEASSLDNGAALSMNTCQNGDANQVWSVNQFGILSSGADSSKCINKNKSNLVIGSCDKNNNNMFMYDANDFSLAWKRNGNKAFFVNNFGNVVLGKKRQSNMNQMWSLTAVEENNELKYVGNPCTDAFADGKCAICTGDCDDDSDCAEGLRCAKRRGTSGLEIVPGCTWGNDDLQFGDDDYCFSPISQPGVLNYVGECGPDYKCGLCEGDCDDDSDCEDGLVCVNRNGFAAVSGCTGEGGDRDMYNKDVCAPLEPTIEDVGNPCTDAFADGKCAICTGDCDYDSDCAEGLRCAQRRGTSGLEIVPGCTWGNDDLQFGNDDYCFLPISQPGVLNYVGECGPDYKCGLCEGDCDDDSDCEDGLICVSRSGFAAVSGCTGEGGDRDVYSKDVCAQPAPPLPPTTFLDSLTVSDSGCDTSSPCAKCEGACTGDDTCIGDLVCFVRSGSESVPGCVTGGDGDVSDTNYCYEEPMNGVPTYIPGDLTKRENGLLLSTGLSARVIATTGNRVTYTGPNGGLSTSNFHEDPDAGAVFSVTSGPNAGGWIYVSNSEAHVGGVGAVTFNADGQVINYEMILLNTSQNCGGGKTYWGTWVTCEENGSSGQVWEVDPMLDAASQRGESTVLGGTGGNYESFAYDARDRLNPTFYVTHDSSRGGMVRFTPDPAVVAQAENTGIYNDVLFTMGTLEWLVLIPENGSINDTSGIFSWTSSRTTGDNSANSFYQYSEGIDVRDGLLYFTTKTSKSLYILDLDNLTYERSSTVSGAFDGQPDQVKRIISEDPSSDMLYFCEEASSDNGIHARDSEGNFYTIIDSDTLNSETTGLAFSPDKRHMYVSYQGDGKIFDISRDDGYPFGAHRLDIKYHAS